jgi:hypothetical protein
VRERHRPGARPTGCRADQCGGSHKAGADHAGARTGKEAIRDRDEDQQRAPTLGREPLGEAVSNRHGDRNIPAREGNNVPEPRRRKVCRKTFVDPLAQPDHDCRGKPASGCWEHAFNGVAESRSE